MRQMNLLGIILVMVFATYGLWILKIVAKAKTPEAPVEVLQELTPIIDNNVLENIHDIVHQKVETTFHDYTVILYKGQVVDKGVIHHYQCKCKKNGK